jgi:hypothetical protein
MLWLLLIQSMASRPAACPASSLHQCGAAVSTVDKGSGLTVTMSQSMTQGRANGETFTEPYWDCDVLVIGGGKTRKATHHADDLHFALKPGKYVVRLDACFGCAMDVPVTLAKGKASIVQASCHTQGK